jgi:hypothetical protein
MDLKYKMDSALIRGIASKEREVPGRKGAAFPHCTAAKPLNYFAAQHWLDCQGFENMYPMDVEVNSA